MNIKTSTAILITILLIMVVIIVGCKTIRYVEVPVSTHDTVMIYNTKLDSIRFYDSISVKGVNDTIFVEKFRYRDRYHFVRDSVYLAKTDTITKVDVREVEKQLTRWEKTKMKVGGWSIGLLIALIVGIAVYLLMKIKKPYK